MKLKEYRQAFTSIAPYYDTLMSFVDYPSWISYIENILRLNNITGKTILDIACGTGICLELWLQQGYRVIGLDKSLAMIETCKHRFNQTPEGVMLVNGDMCQFALAEKIPIITCLYDSLNYILDENRLRSCFQKVYETLDNGGIFIFDMNTVHCLRDEWGNGTFHRKDGNVHSEWSNSFNRATNISTLRITLTVNKNGQSVMIKENHQERGYLLSLIADLLDNAGFTFSFYRHLTFNPAHEQDMRIMGVAKK